MGNRSPGKIKREGRRAFEQGTPINNCPSYWYDRDLWIEGWREAKDEEVKKDNEEFRLKTRTTYEIPLSEFETLGDLMDALETYKKNE